MKNAWKLFALTLALLTLSPTLALAGAGGFIGEKFIKQVYFEGAAGKGSLSGTSWGNAKAIVDGDVWAIPAGTLVEMVYIVVDSAITGTTAIDVGDDDGAETFLADTAVTYDTPDLYGFDLKPSKYFGATGKEVKLDVTGTNTAGRFRLVIEGVKLGL